MKHARPFLIGPVLIFLTAMFVLTSLVTKASAHEVAPTIVTLKLSDDQTYALTVKTNIEALLAKIGPQHEDTEDAPTSQIYNTLRQLPPTDLEPRFRSFTGDYLGNIGLTFGDTPVDPVIEAIDIPPIGDTDLARESAITLSGKIPEGSKTLSWAYPEKFGASVLRIEREGQDLQAQFFAAGVQSDAIALGIAEQRNWWETPIEYGVVGFTHILPKGLDHILFVLGLFLLSTSWRPLVWQVTAFTIAHSVTLALGLYGIVSISPTIVEPLIALSIVYVAVENLFTKTLHAWRPVIVFAFGLLHGLGFAGILTEIGLPRSDFVLGLVAFNVGVELGQLAVIGLAFLLVWRWVGKLWYRKAIVIPASLAIAAMGAWWFAERTGMIS